MRGEGEDQYRVSCPLTCEGFRQVNGQLPRSRLAGKDSVPSGLRRGTANLVWVTSGTVSQERGSSADTLWTADSLTSSLDPCTELERVPPNYMSFPEPENVTSCGNSVVVDVMSYNEVVLESGGS